MLHYPYGMSMEIMVWNTFLQGRFVEFDNATVTGDLQ